MSSQKVPLSSIQQRSADQRRQFNNSSKKKTFKDFSLKDLIKEEAGKTAEKIYDEAKNSKDKKNKNTQIRKFFDDLFNIKLKIGESKDIENYLPMIYMVASKAAYSNGRNLIGSVFYEFIKQVREIETKDDFMNFMLYFEAMLGYYKFMNPKD